MLCECKTRRQTKDTVATDEEDDKVNANHHVGEDGASVGHDAVVHDGIPVFSGQNLERQREELAEHRESLSVWE